jgi:exopolyphosphatase/guanosine-5'-triphosphate,3'-diphosphate pyrophosphatase
MDRTLACLQVYREVVDQAGVHPGSVRAVATASARDSRNGPQFFERVFRETGSRFQTLSGEQEARLMFTGGLLPGMDPAQSAVIDIGGGSTELRSLNSGLSLQMGSVRFTERYLKSDPVSDSEFWLCQDAIDALLESSEVRKWREGLSDGTRLVAVAGTATTLASWHEDLVAFDRDRIDSCVLTRGDLHRQVEELKWRTFAERRAIPGMEPKRADVLLAGAMILWRASELLCFDRVQVSSRGLRFGALSLQPPV